MGITVGIFGMSGDGKTTSTIINPDGSVDIDFKPDGSINTDNYKGMDPKSHYIINCDLKELPFPGGMWGPEITPKNYLATSNFDTIADALKSIATAERIKSVSIDTLNVYLAYKEFNDRKKLTFDQWRDIANDILDLITLCNTVLRKDQIAYILGHVELITDVDGNEKKVLATVGKKARKQQPEGFFPVCIFTEVEYGNDGENKHYFQTKAAKSSAKTPVGMFSKDEFRIPNSLALLDSRIRKYYKL